MKKTANAIQCLSVFAVFYLIFYLKKDGFYIYSLSHSEILKAMDWLSGNPFWPGPRLLFKDGALPGPFFYFLLIPPLLFNKAYPAIILYLTGWLSLTFTAAFYFVKKITKERLSPLLFLTLLFTSVFFRKELPYLYLNSLFSIIFHLAAAICLFEFRKKRDIFLILAGLFIGLGVQVHYSVLFHFVTAIALALTDDRILRNQFPWRHFAAFLSVFFILQFPYFFALLTAGEGLGQFIYIVNYEYEHINELMINFLSSPLKSFGQIFRSLDLHGRESLVRALIMLLMGILGCAYKKAASKKAHLPDEAAFDLFFIFFCPILLAFPFMSADQNSFFLFLFFLIFFVKAIDNFWPEKNWAKRAAFLFFGSVLTLNLLTSAEIDLIAFSYRFSYRLELFALLLFVFALSFFSSGRLSFDGSSKRRSSGTHPALAGMSIVRSAKARFAAAFAIKFALVFSLALSMAPVLIVGADFSVTGNFGEPARFKGALKKIYQDTGWSGKEALRRVFQLRQSGNYPDFLFYYRLAASEAEPTQKSGAAATAAGYFLYREKENKDLKALSAEELRASLLSEVLPDEARREIESGAIVPQTPEQVQGNMWIIPYSAGERSMFPKGFHNMDSSLFEESDWSKKFCHFPFLMKDKGAFRLCYAPQRYMNEKITLVVSFARSGGKDFLKARIEGYPLSLASTDKRDFHFIKDISVDFLCRGRREKVKLLSRIGLNVNQTEHFKSFFAPIEIRAPIRSQCAGEAEELTVSFEDRMFYEEFRQISFSYP